MGKIKTGIYTLEHKKRVRTVRSLIYKKYGMVSSFISYNGLTEKRLNNLILDENNYKILISYLELLPDIDKQKVHFELFERYVTIKNYQKRCNPTVEYHSIFGLMNHNFNTLKYKDFAIKLYKDLGFDNYIFPKFEV